MLIRMAFISRGFEKRGVLDENEPNSTGARRKAFCVR